VKGDLSDCQEHLRIAVAAWEHLRRNKASKGAIFEAHRDVLYWKRRVRAMKAKNNVPKTE